MTKKIYRSRNQAYVWRIMLVVMIAYVAVGFGRVAAADRLTPANIALLTIVGLPFIVALWRGAITGVHVQARGVRVVNPLKTHVIAWEDIDRFSVGATSLLPKVGMVELRNGERLPIWSIQGADPATRPHNRSAETIIDALNSEVERHRTDVQPIDESPTSGS